MPDTPQSIDAIRDRRAEAAAPPPSGSGSLFASLSSGGPSTTTANTTPPKKIFCVLSWNVQTYSAERAQRNALVNLVINRILDRLEVDLALLLETRDNPSVNLAAIENAEADKTTEQDLDYQAMASELTGKALKLPGAIKFYQAGAEPEHRHPRLVKLMSAPSDAPEESEPDPDADPEEMDQVWKTVCEYNSSPKLTRFYELVWRDTGTKVLDAMIPYMERKDEAGLEFRLKSCSACGVRLGRREDDPLTCAKCAELGPNSAYARELVAWLLENSFALSWRAAQETYSVLVRHSSARRNGPYGWLLLPGKEAVVHRVGSRFASEAYLDDAWTVSPFLDSTVKTQLGRSPYLVQTEIRFAGAHGPARTPIVGFHAPYGGDDAAGWERRRTALRHCLDLDVGAGGRQRFGDNPNAVLIGDFNLDHQLTGSASDGKRIVQAKGFFQDFADAGYPARIDRCATSLKAPPRKTSEFDAFLGRALAATADVTSSAYDNVMMSDALWTHAVQACAVDVIGHIAANKADFALPDDDPFKARAGEMSDLQYAFYLYRTYVSDHLPVLVDFLTEPMSNSAQADAIDAAFEEARGRGPDPPENRPSGQKHPWTVADWGGWCPGDYKKLSEALKADGVYADLPEHPSAYQGKWLNEARTRILLLGEVSSRRTDGADGFIAAVRCDVYYFEIATKVDPPPGAWVWAVLEKPG